MNLRFQLLIFSRKFKVSKNCGGQKSFYPFSRLIDESTIPIVDKLICYKVYIILLKILLLSLIKFGKNMRESLKNLKMNTFLIDKEREKID